MSSNSSLNHLLTSCLDSRMTVLFFTCQFIVSILLFLPLFLFIFYLGLQRWWRQRVSASTVPVMSHSDFFTYNMAAMDTISILAPGLESFSVSTSLQVAAYSIFTLTIPGQTLFHLLTCVERYLAVVHPVTYLGLKQAAGVRIRNISCGCVWLLCCGMMGLIQVISSFILTFIYFGLMFFFLVIVCFCTVSILCALRRPGPGRLSGDPSKRRAFHTVVAIMVALMCRLVGVLLCSVLFTLRPLTDLRCAVGASAMWATAPGSLVLPLLFLQRAGKVPGGRNRAREP